MGKITRQIEWGTTLCKACDTQVHNIAQLDLEQDLHEPWHAIIKTWSSGFIGQQLLRMNVAKDAVWCRR